MSESIGFYDEIVRVGNRILETLAGPSPAAMTKAKVRTYLGLVAQIYRLLARVHDKVATVAVRVALSTTVAEAKQSLQGIEHDALEATFRAKRWCDRFEKLGRGLRPLGERVGLPADDLRIWDEFCASLELREAEAARLYDQKLNELRTGNDSLSLEALKAKVEGASRQLVTQKAEFDLLAKRADALRERLK